MNWSVHIYDGSGEPYIETEEDQAFTDLLTRFHFANRRRYRRQAKKLVREGTLLVRLGTSLIKYSLKDGFARCKVSEDGGRTYSNLLQQTPLPARRERKIELIAEQFAHSEARETLEI